MIERDLKALIIFIFIFVAYSLVGYILSEEYDNPANRIGLAMLFLYLGIHLYNIFVFCWNKFRGIIIDD